MLKMNGFIVSLIRGTRVSIVFIVKKFPSVKKIKLLMQASATNLRYVCVTFDNLILCHIGYCVVDGASPLQSDE